MLEAQLAMHLSPSLATVKHWTDFTSYSCFAKKRVKEIETGSAADCHYTDVIAPRDSPSCRRRRAVIETSLFFFRPFLFDWPVTGKGSRVFAFLLPRFRVFLRQPRRICFERSAGSIDDPDELVLIDFCGGFDHESLLSHEIFCYLTHLQYSNKHSKSILL